ncbi:MAG TPA: hypothetical protein VJK51_05145 [Candidatus Nanoarchaeia archaeon]|nr:hypothetical protein [Candidatus Nanoarchaeia archaeon]
MEIRGTTKRAQLVLTLLLLATFIHTTTHLGVYGTGIPSVYEKGISGFSIGKTNLGEELQAQKQKVSPLSIIFLGFEWLLIGSTLIFIILKRKQEVNLEITETPPEKIERPKNKTDLDVLYDLLQEKKHLKLTTITKLFNVSNEVAIDWAQILEGGELATIHYPRMGEPELHIANEETKTP